MFIGNKEHQQATTQKLLEAATYLRRAFDALMVIEGMVAKDEDRQEVAADRGNIRDLADTYDSWFRRAAKEVFSESR